MVESVNDCVKLFKTENNMSNFQKSTIFVASAYLCLSMCICTNSNDSFNKPIPLAYNKTDIEIGKQSSTNNQFLDSTILSEGGLVTYNAKKLKNSTISRTDPSPTLSSKPIELNSSNIFNSTAGNYSSQHTQEQSTSNSVDNKTLWDLSNTESTDVNSSNIFVTEENVQKIVPRKGVEQTVVTDNIPTPTSSKYSENSTLKLNNNSLNISVIHHLQEVLKDNISNLASNETEESNIKSFPPLSKKKSKPLTAMNELRRNTSASANPTISSAKKNDYVIPVVAVILAVPLISVLVMFFYKKGTEFWERRHYRRMDFLIDGMYND